MNEHHGERGKRRIEQDPIGSVRVRNVLFGRTRTSLTSSRIQLAVAPSDFGTEQSNGDGFQVQVERLHSTED
jgi:hypothetical protein